MAEPKKVMLTKEDMKHLPSTNGDSYKEQCAYYTEMVFSRVPKLEAFKLAFPERYQHAVDAAGGNPNVVNANVKKNMNQVERSAFMQRCFAEANKHWWMKFMGKKQAVFEKLYNDALDDNLEVKDRHNASKIFLANIPDAPKEEKITVEVKVGSDEFKQMLAQKKRQLYSVANNESIEEAEVIDNE